MAAQGYHNVRKEVKSSKLTVLTYARTHFNTKTHMY